MLIWRNTYRKISKNRSKTIRGYLWGSFSFSKAPGTHLSCWNPVSLFHRFSFFWETFISKKRFEWLLPHDFHLFVFSILAFNGITLSISFGMACDLYRRCSTLFMAAMGYLKETMSLVVDQNYPFFEIFRTRILLNIM